ncbi:hypothetical protein MBLNU230_g8527t1 [Neophaeotheca triangularis]
MPRNRRAKPELSASWDDVEESDEYNAEIYSEEDERSEVGSRYLPDRASRQQTPRKKTGEDDLQTSEPDLVMPSSPDGERGARKAGMRASTPHFRMNQRSFTSDAGRFGQPAPREQERSSRLKDEYDDQIDDESDLNFLSTLWTSFLRPVVSYVGGSLGMALNNLKPIIGWAIVVWLVFGILTFGGNFFAYKLNQALSPLCRIPGVSYLDLPFCPTASETSQLGSGPAEFDKLVQAQSAFEDVLQSTSHGVNLPMDMKRSEASIRDLKHVVQYSTLPSRNELVFEFGGFIDTARQASHDLSKFNSRIGRAVDQILSTNRWTLNVIDGVQAADANRGSIARWASRNLNILAPFQPVLISRDILLEQYLRHTTAIEDEISTLITEAQALLAVLDNLDNRLDVIASIATRDGVKALADKNELFEYLWTKLGGNKNSVERLNSQLSLLKDVGTYRTNAWNLISVTIVKLQAIRDQLEDLRERVALPEVVGDKVPLEVHVESINLGIERLEGQRERGRRLAEESYARVIGKGEGKGLGERLEVGRE